MDAAAETMKQPPYCDENGMRLIAEQRERISELEAALKLIASGMQGDRILNELELSDIAQRALRQP